MNIVHIGADGDHVHLRNLLAEQTALQSGVDADDLPVLAEAGATGFLVNRLNFGICTEIPSWIPTSVTYVESAHGGTSFQDTANVIQAAFHGGA